MSKQIPLTQGKFAIVDDADYDWLMQYKWRVQCSNSGLKYALTGRGVSIHRLILGLIKSDRTEVDHIDGDGLNNQRNNLRTATHSQNMANRKKHSNNKSGVQGVYKDKKSNKWRVEIRANGVKTCLGSFDDIDDARRAYEKASHEYHGDFCRLKTNT